MTPSINSSKSKASFLPLAVFTVLVVLPLPPVSAEIVSIAPLPKMKEGAWDSLKVKWNRPESENNSNGNHIGNNFVGAIIKGGVATEILQLNDKTFWSGGPSRDQDPKRKLAMEESRRLLAMGDIPAADHAAKGMWGSQEVGTYLPLGTLYLKFTHGDQAKNYVRQLDLDQALSTVQYDIDGVTYTRETFATYPDRVIVMRLTASQAGKLSFTASFQYPKEMEGQGASVATEGNDILVMKGRAPAHLKRWHPTQGMTYQSRLSVKTVGGKVFASGKELQVEGADSVFLIYANATSYNGPFKEPGMEGLDPDPLVKTTLSAVSHKSYDDLFQSHVRDYRELFRRLWVELNGEIANKYAIGLQYTRYDLIAVSRAGDRPHNQQGMWNSSWKPPSWCSQFLNENAEKYYYIAEPANIAETTGPLWNWMDQLAATGAETAKIDWGFKGWLAPHYSDVWASTTIKGGNNEWSIWPMGGVWLCQNLWDHYAYSLDLVFLRDRAYPLMKGAAEFCLDYLVDDGTGRLVTAPSTSPENRFDLPDGKTYAISQGATMDLALIRQLFQNCIEASTLLKVDTEFQARLQAALAKILPFQINDAGELQEWSQDFKKHYNGHRHASHVVAVWPLSQITERGTPELFQAATAAMQDRMPAGGNHPDASAMWARLKNGDESLKFLGGKGHGIATQFPPIYNGMMEMFLFSHNRDSKGGYELELLPALPTSWKSGKISGIRGRGGYELEIEWENGELKKCRIDSKFATIPVIRYRDKIIDPASDARITLNLLKF